MPCTERALSVSRARRRRRQPRQARPAPCRHSSSGLHRSRAGAARGRRRGPWTRPGAGNRAASSRSCIVCLDAARSAAWACCRARAAPSSLPHHDAGQGDASRHATPREQRRRTKTCVRGTEARVLCTAAFGQARRSERRAHAPRRAAGVGSGAAEGRGGRGGRAGGEHLLLLGRRPCSQVLHVEVQPARERVLSRGCSRAPVTRGRGGCAARGRAGRGAHRRASA